MVTAKDVSSTLINQRDLDFPMSENSASCNPTTRNFDSDPSETQTWPLDVSGSSISQTSTKLPQETSDNRPSIHLNGIPVTSHSYNRDPRQNKLNSTLSSEILSSRSLQTTPIAGALEKAPQNAETKTPATFRTTMLTPYQISELDAENFSKFAPPLYTISYLILFSILGTLARIGIEALTRFSNPPVAFSSIWANFAGCFIMGFLVENRVLFHDELEVHTENEAVSGNRPPQNHHVEGKLDPVERVPVQKTHSLSRKTIPLYTGITTGFCGCLTSFSSFLRDVFLTLANRLPKTSGTVQFDKEKTKLATPVSRNFGYSVLASFDVVLVTICLCITSFYFGTHLAKVLKARTPRLPLKFIRRYPDRYAIFLAFGGWLCTTLTMILALERNARGISNLPTQLLFSLVFAPLGCLARSYASLYLNPLSAAFPWGTFTVNMVGTIILGISYDLQRLPLSGPIPCQILQGLQDGFCGSLTTVSTWVAELTSIKKRNAYIYGTLSVILSLSSLIVCMGSMLWTRGWKDFRCTS